MIIIYEIKNEVAYATKQNAALKDFFDLLFPQSLNEHEYVSLTFLNRDTGLTLDKSCKTFEEFESLILKYRPFYDCYVSLATVRERDGEVKRRASHLCKRSVLFLDFDLKDYPDSDFSDLIRSKTDTFTHMVVNSGNGYHYYIAVDTTKDVKALVKLNSELCALVGADPNAVKSTQIARVPCSYNHKLAEHCFDYEDVNNCKYAKIVTSATGNANFYRYEIGKLAAKIGLETRTAAKLEQLAAEYNPKDVCRQCTYYCNNSIFENGAPQGQRNFWLGRLTKWFQKNGMTYQFALGNILDWNKRCYPPQEEGKVKRDFQCFWSNDYKLLGCVNNIPNKKYSEYVERVCDPAQCKTSNGINITGSHGIQMATSLLQGKKLKTLDGYHYLLLTLIYMYGACGMTVDKLYKRLTVSLDSGRYIVTAMSKEQADKILNELVDMKIITITAPRNRPDAPRKQHRIRMAKRFREFENGFISFYFSAAMILRVKGITYAQYKTYLLLIRHLQNGEPCTLEALAKDMGITKQTIGEHIQALENAGLLIIRKQLTERGLCKYNHYTLLDPTTLTNGVGIYDGNTEISEIRLTA